MEVPEPKNKSLAVWYLPARGVPVVVMARIDEYEEESAPGERWFVADQHFTTTDESTHGFTWKELLKRFQSLTGPHIFSHDQGVKYDES